MTEPAETAWEEEQEVGPVEVDLDCDNCGAKMTWDPASDALSCDHCGHEREVPRGEGLIEERPLSEAGSAARGLGLELKVGRCENCDARVSFDTAATSTTCVFCGFPSLMPQEANRNLLRPESLIPLDVERDVAREAFRQWVAGLWFRPNALRRAKSLTAAGVYVPAWTFDAHVHSEWSADSGTYYWVTQTYTTTVNGRPVTRTRQVRKTRWRPAWGERDDSYDDLQIIASHVVRGDLARKLGEFDTRALVPYRPEYLAGWQAEEYQLDLEQGWSLGKQRIAASQRQRCAGDVPGDTHRNLRVRDTLSDVRWKHVLLPMWSLTYRFRGKAYPVLIHGQTGKVVGEAPYSWVKILCAVLGVVALALLIAALAGGLG